MIITDDLLEEFRGIYRNRFNRELSDDDAIYEATRLLELVRPFLVPISSEALARAEKRVLEHWNGIVDRATI